MTDTLAQEVKITSLESIPAIGIEHKGSYMEVGRAFEQLFDWAVANDAIRGPVRMLATYYDDPNLVPEDELRSMALLTGGAAPADGVTTHPHEIEGGEYAVYLHKGPYASMRAAYDWLYGQWLPNSGREAADKPNFEEYLNNPREVAPSELLTNIYVPLVAL